MTCVLFAVTGLARGGAETQLARVGVELRRRGWGVTVLSLMAVEHDFGLEDAGVRVASLGLGRAERPSRAHLATALRVARAADPDVLCAFLYHAILLGAALAPTLRVPLVASIRDGDFGSRLRENLMRGLVAARVIETLTANSRRVAGELDRIMPMAPGREVLTVPNAVAAPLRRRSRQDVREALGVSEGTFLWLHVANFRPNKDHPTLLDAFVRVRGRGRNVALRLVGVGEPPAALAKRIASEPDVINLGERDDVPDLMAAADGLVLSSLVEGVPNVLLEAMSARCGVVSTSVDGVPELIEDGVTGMLCPPSDPAALAERMVATMGLTEAERTAQLDAAERFVEERHALAPVVDVWEDVLFGAIRGGRA